MSRIGVLPVEIPANAKVTIDKKTLTAEGPKGTLYARILPGVKVTQTDNQVIVERESDEIHAKERHGLVRTLIANAIKGATEGFSKSLVISGVGFKVQVSGNSVVLNLGYSHSQEVALPEGVTAAVEGNTLTISGADKQQVGQVAASIRALRPPEPYKGKGVAYVDERIIRKAGKAAGAGK